MAMKMTNISEKVIGIGNMVVLPGSTVEVPADYESNPTLETYKALGLVTLSGKAKAEADKKADSAKTKADAEAKAKADAEAAAKAEEEAKAKAEADKKAKLASLKDASDEDVAAMANELGINPAECKDLADVRKKVKAALSK